MEKNTIKIKSKNKKEKETFLESNNDVMVCIHKERFAIKIHFLKAHFSYSLG